MSAKNIFTPPSLGVLTLTHVLNPLDVRQRTITTLPYVQGQALAAYLPPPEEFEEYIASVNGQIVEQADFDKTIPLDGDSIVLCPVMLGGKGSGKTILRLVAMIVVSVFAGPLAAQLGSAMGPAFAAGTTGLKLLTAGVTMVGSMLVNAAFSPAAAKANLATGTGAGHGAVQMSNGAVAQPTGPGTAANYSYQGAKSTQGEGVPVALCYGEYIVGGHLIEIFVDSEGQSQVLHVLYSAGEGEIAGIEGIQINESPIEDYLGDGVQVETRLGTGDQSPIGWFDRQVSTVSVSMGITEGGAWSPTRTTTRRVDKLRFAIAFPSGLAGFNRRGDVLTATARFELQYRMAGTSEWTTIPAEYASASRSSVRFQTATPLLEEGIYEARVRYLGSSIAVTAPPAKTEDDTPSGTDIMNGTPEQFALTNFGTNMGLQGTRYSDGSVVVSGFDGIVWVKKNDAGQVVVQDTGVGPNSFTLIKPPHGYVTTPIDANSVQISFYTEASDASKYRIDVSQVYFDRNNNPLQSTYYNAAGELLGPPVVDEEAGTRHYQIHWDGLMGESPYYKPPAGAVPGYKPPPAGKPTITVRVGAADSSVPDNGEAQTYQLFDQSTDGYWSELEEIITDPVSHIHTALIGLRIPMTSNRISGMPNITFRHKGKLIRVWNKATGEFEMKASSNPAWIVYDILTNNRYGAGIAEASVDMDSLKDWAAFCDEEELTFNGVFDAQQNLWDGLQYVLKAGHATLLRVGTKYAVTVERPSQPVMMFSQANMLEGSYQETWLPTQDRANEIELSYFEPTDRFKQRTIKVYDPRIIGSGRPVRNSSATLYGVTDAYRAFLEGVLLLNMNRYILKTCEFDAPVEAIACTVGDVIYVANASTDWAQSGRLAAGCTTTLLQLDTPLTVDPAKQYKVLVHISAVRRASATVMSIVAGSALVQLDTLVTEPFKRLRLVAKGIDTAAKPSSSFGWISLDSAQGLEVGDTVELIDTDVIAERDVINDLTWVPGQTTQVLQIATPLYRSSEQLLTPRTEMAKDADDIFDDLETAHFMFGESTKVRQKFRVTSISGTSSLNRHISCVQYDERVFSLDASMFENIATTLNDFRVFPPTNLQAVETIYAEGNEYKSRVNFSWSAPRKMLVTHYEATITNYHDPSASIVVNVPANGRSVVTEKLDNCPAGVWDLAVAAVNHKGQKSEPARNTIHVNGAAPYISKIGMPAPQDPSFTLEMDSATNSVSSIRVNTGYTMDERGIAPEGMIFFLATDRAQNKIKIISGGVGDRLLIGGVDFVQGTIPFSEGQLAQLDLQSGYNFVDTEFTILPGSRRDYIQLQPTGSPTPYNVKGMPLEGRYWCAWNNGLFRSATRFDEWGLYVDPPFIDNPPIGQRLEWLEMGFHDERAYEFRMGFIADGTGRYEVIRWEAMEHTHNGIELLGVERGVEGTTPLNADGLELHYYPAYGPGTFTEVLSAANGDFAPDTSSTRTGRYTATRNLMVPLKNLTWASASCCTYAVVGGTIVRSPIVPIRHASSQ